MEYNISRPSAALAPYVKQYWSLESCVPEGGQHIQRIVPSGLFELIFYLGERPGSSDLSREPSDTVTLTGQLRSHHDLLIRGDLSLFAIYFHPHGLSMFLDLPLSELLDQSVSFRHLAPEVVSKLEDELLEAGDHAGQIRVAEDFLLQRLQLMGRKYHFERIRHSIARINRARGSVDIGELAMESFLSRKQFERSFQEIIGASPKQFLKIVRFQNAIYERSRQPELSLTELSHLCGYYDQAHMIHEFRTLTGLTPGAFFSGGEAISDYFS